VAIAAMDGDDRLALVAFNNRARLVSPLTVDADALAAALSSVTPARGSRLDEGLRCHRPDTRLCPWNQRPHGKPVRLHGHAELTGVRIPGNDGISVDRTEGARLPCHRCL
jgi:hypothetical protein